MQFAVALFVILFILLIGLIPFFLLYPVSDALRWALFSVFKYRRKVVAQNLEETFPGLNKTEIRKISWDFYRNLSDVIVEGIKAFTMTRGQIRSRHKVLNPEVAIPFNEMNRSIIGLPSHYGNWEWGSMSGALQLPQKYVVFYKPLKNKWVDTYTRWSRSKYNGNLVSIYQTRKVFEEHHAKNSIFIMASDQSPTNPDKSFWVTFLGRDTAFLHGPEYYAKKYDLPVIFVDIQRVRRGFYELELVLITDKPRETAEGEITGQYARLLEKAIDAKPGNWLWSHRRWKLRRQP
jgi:KDO2-lipid IV(A) lauroyltransferase